eukprot:CAMPEP_0173203394 /NCGR_PEP_ID=MMETSP1141-20130122/19494_1 /TAXON_ID=483371 /ORGANISM="non described non described, Strain CCMP2298" /LENGTH=101 /DNA_ID=CAMNT_0014128845 /DNA_START=130 /DNA_END=435 /DNA_ORIENTATION=-
MSGGSSDRISANTSASAIGVRANANVSGADGRDHGLADRAHADLLERLVCGALKRPLVCGGEQEVAVGRALQRQLAERAHRHVWVQLCLRGGVLGVVCSTL